MNPPNPLAELHVRAAFLQAVIAVYEPWLTSPVVQEAERRLASRRVATARRELERLTPPRWSDGVWKAQKEGS